MFLKSFVLNASLRFSSSLWIETRFESVENLRDVLRAHTARQLGQVIAAEESLSQSPSILLAATGEHVVIDQTPHPAKFPHRVEVAHEGHPRINPLAVLLVKRLGRAEVGDVHPDQRRLQPATGGTDAEVASAKLLLGRLPLHREEVVPHIESRWREDVDRPQEQARTCTSAFLIVAVEAINFGRTCLPFTSQVQSLSMAVSYKPTSVPSGPLMRCNSS